MGAKPPRSVTGVTPDILENMDDYMDNMNNAVINKKSALEQLVATNYKHYTTINKKPTTILTLLGAVKQLQPNLIDRGGRGSRGRKSDYTRKFLKEGYCWSHGYNLSHMIPDCLNKK